MKTISLITFILFTSLFIKAQSSYELASLGHVLGNGTVVWHTTQAQLSSYLKMQMNNNLNISGNITSSTILLVNGIYKVEGKGVATNSNSSRNIRMDLIMDANGDLYFNFLTSSGNTTETCVGDPCEECEFASGGGCKCNRTSSSQTGVGGTCNHSISKPTNL